MHLAWLVYELANRFTADTCQNLFKRGISGLLIALRFPIKPYDPVTNPLQGIHSCETPSEPNSVITLINKHIQRSSAILS